MNLCRVDSLALYKSYISSKLINLRCQQPGLRFFSSCLLSIITSKVFKLGCFDTAQMEDFLKFLKTFMDFPPCKILPYSAKFRQILPNSPKFCQFLLVPAKLKISQILPISAKFCQILLRFAIFCQILPNSIKFCQIPPISTKFCKILPYFAKFGYSPQLMKGGGENSACESIDHFSLWGRCPASPSISIINYTTDHLMLL